MQQLCCAQQQIAHMHNLKIVTNATIMAHFRNTEQN